MYRSLYTCTRISVRYIYENEWKKQKSLKPHHFIEFALKRQNRPENRIRGQVMHVASEEF